LKKAFIRKEMVWKKVVNSKKEEIYLLCLLCRYLVIFFMKKFFQIYYSNLIRSLENWIYLKFLNPILDKL